MTREDYQARIQANGNVDIPDSVRYCSVKPLSPQVVVANLRLTAPCLV